jgi:hypothetical protein
MELRPGATDAPNLLGDVLIGLGRLPEAVEAYDLGLWHDPRSLAALRGRAEALRRMGQGHEAVATLDVALALGHDLARVQELTVARARLLQSLGRWDAAAEDLGRLAGGGLLDSDEVAEWQHGVEAIATVVGGGSDRYPASGYRRYGMAWDEWDDYDAIDLPLRLQFAAQPDRSAMVRIASTVGPALAADGAGCTAAMLWSGRFALLRVRSDAAAAATVRWALRGAVAEVDAVWPLVEVVNFAARGVAFGEDPVEAWSVATRPVPDGGPDFGVGIGFWVPEPADQSAFDAPWSDPEVDAILAGPFAAAAGPVPPAAPPVVPPVVPPTALTGADPFDLAVESSPPFDLDVEPVPFGLDLEHEEPVPEPAEIMAVMIDPSDVPQSEEPAREPSEYRQYAMDLVRFAANGAGVVLRRPDGTGAGLDRITVDGTVHEVIAIADDQLHGVRPIEAVAVSPNGALAMFATGAGRTLHLLDLASGGTAPLLEGVPKVESAEFLDEVQIMVKTVSWLAVFVLTPDGPVAIARDFATIGPATVCADGRLIVTGGIREPELVVYGYADGVLGRLAEVSAPINCYRVWTIGDRAFAADRSTFEIVGMLPAWERFAAWAGTLAEAAADGGLLVEELEDAPYTGINDGLDEISDSAGWCVRGPAGLLLAVRSFGERYEILVGDTDGVGLTSPPLRGVGFEYDWRPDGRALLIRDQGSGDVHEVDRGAGDGPRRRYRYRPGRLHRDRVRGAAWRRAGPVRLAARIAGRADRAGAPPDRAGGLDARLGRRWQGAAPDGRWQHGLLCDRRRCALPDRRVSGPGVVQRLEPRRGAFFRQLPFWPEFSSLSGDRVRSGRGRCTRQ